MGTEEIASRIFGARDRDRERTEFFECGVAGEGGFLTGCHDTTLLYPLTFFLWTEAEGRIRFYAVNDSYQSVSTAIANKEVTRRGSDRNGKNRSVQ